MAEDIVMKILKEHYSTKTFKCPTRHKKNSDYDIVEDSKSPNRLTIEVKFDIKANKTKNLCFEFTNGKIPTGVCVSKAHEIWYVLETDVAGQYKIFKFQRAALLQYLLYTSITETSKLKVLYGGDNKKFGLIIVPIETIIKDNVGEIFTWQEQKN